MHSPPPKLYKLKELHRFKRHGYVSDVTRKTIEALDKARSKGWNTGVIWIGPFPLVIVVDKEGIQVLQYIQLFRQGVDTKTDYMFPKEESQYVYFFVDLRNGSASYSQIRPC